MMVPTPFSISEGSGNISFLRRFLCFLISHEASWITQNIPELFIFSGGSLIPQKKKYLVPWKALDLFSLSGGSYTL